MVAFLSYKAEFCETIEKIVQVPSHHAKWLNTLSYMENCGARKIAQCEHPTHVKEEMLKHAAEEFRHAHYLKHQIKKINGMKCEDYSSKYLLGGINTLHYLNAIDLYTSRYLTEECNFGDIAQIKAASYLLVTYAIECRAKIVYPTYQAILKEKGFKISVSSIIFEEEEHLAEIQNELKGLVDFEKHCQKVTAFESQRCHEWIKSLKNSLV